MHFDHAKPRPGRGQGFEAEAKAMAEAEAKASRPRLRPKFWSRGQLRLKGLTSLKIATVNRNRKQSTSYS